MGGGVFMASAVVLCIILKGRMELTFLDCSKYSIVKTLFQSF